MLVSPNSALAPMDCAQFRRTNPLNNDLKSKARANMQQPIMMQDLRGQFDRLVGQSHAGLTVTSADEFSYLDPVDGFISKNQGVRIAFEGGRRAVFRLSGTGTQGATVRLYLEQYSGQGGDIGLDTQTALQNVRDAAFAISAMEAIIGRVVPDAIT
jgi:phosphoglucomutase